MNETIQSSLNRTFKDRFLLTFNLPEAMKNIHTQYVKLSQQAGITKDSIDFSLIGVNIPAVTTKSENVQYAGASINVSSHTRSPYDPLTIRFKIDNSYANYLTIYSWLNFIYDGIAGYFDPRNLASNHSIESYQTNLSIIALDNYKNPVIQWIFTHAYPSNLSAIEYDYQSSDELDCSATFEFAQMMVRHIALDRLELQNSKPAK